jgi:hypothetical protein
MSHSRKQKILFTFNQFLLDYIFQLDENIHNIGSSSLLSYPEIVVDCLNNSNNKSFSISFIIWWLNFVEHQIFFNNFFTCCKNLLLKRYESHHSLPNIFNSVRGSFRLNAVPFTE